MDAVINRPAIDHQDLPARPLVQEREAELGWAEQQALNDRIKRLLKEHNAALVAHFYTSGYLQDLAMETGGHVADSLEMARFGTRHPGDTLVVAGVRFMGETAKILNPEKRVLMPSLEATCSLDLGCPADQFAAFCDAHPEHTVVVYANTSAAVKARADWVVTSSIAVDVIRYLADQGEKILWAPDRHLGRYLEKVTGADILHWPGSCIVHEAFKREELKELMERYPAAEVLVHPESPEGVIELADVVGSTSRLIRAVQESPAETFIVATDRGIFHRMQELAPTKTFLEAPTAGKSATCKSCAHCPWMAMNGLQNLAKTLETGRNEIQIDPAIQEQARIPLQRMLDFAEQRRQRVVGDA